MRSAIAVEAREVAVLRPPAFGEDLHREGLPGRVGGPPALVRGPVARRAPSRGTCRRWPARPAPRMTEGLSALQHVRDAAGQVRRRGAALALPEREPAVRALEAFEPLSVAPATSLSFAGSMPGRRKASPRSAARASASASEDRCSAQPYGYSHEVARAFAQTHERGGRGVDVQAAETGHDARGQLERSRAPRPASARRPPPPPARRGPRPGTVSSNASVSPSSFAVICTRARPTRAVRGRRSGLSLAAPPVMRQRPLRRRPRPRGGRDRGCAWSRWPCPCP